MSSSVTPIPRPTVRRPPWWWRVLRAIGGRVISAHRAQVALWEKVYAWPPADGTLEWVDTVNGPALRGNILPPLPPELRDLH